eukprot:SAG31_NODE_742_length_12424_cov_16.082353_5_plen_93_part_00
MLKDESSGRSMEESVIATSLKAIQGAHRDNIILLFRALALAPEDAQLPLEVTIRLYQAESGSLDRQPKLLSIRRWLKVLIDRSLVGILAPYQ